MTQADDKKQGASYLDVLDFPETLVTSIVDRKTGQIDVTERHTCYIDIKNRIRVVMDQRLTRLARNIKIPERVLNVKQTLASRRVPFTEEVKRCREIREKMVKNDLDFFNRTGVSPKFAEPGKEADQNTVVLEFHGIDSICLNRLRRLMLTDMPQMSIRRVQISINTDDKGKKNAPMDDIVLHTNLERLPLDSDASKFRYSPAPKPDIVDMYHKGIDISPEEFASETKAYENVNLKDRPEYDMKLKAFEVLYLDVRHPASATEPRIIMSSDLVTKKAAGTKDADALVRPMRGDIMIGKLVPGGHLKLTALVTQGNGNHHAKHMPVTARGFVHEMSVKIDDDIKGEAAQTLHDLCPQRVFGLKRVKNPHGGETKESKDIEDLSVFVENPELCNMCNNCKIPQWEKPLFNPPVIERLDNVWLWTVVSRTNEPAILHVDRAIDVWVKQCKQLSELHDLNFKKAGIDRFEMDEGASL